MKSTEPRLYRVNEIFCSLQGEGFFTGTASVFIRLSGCNRTCPFCDTDFSRYTLMTAAEIGAEAAGYPARHAVITGGEPLLQLDSELTEVLHSLGFFIAIETNGTLPVPAGVDWVTCSPKDKPWAIDRIDELKIVYQGQDVEAIREALPEAGHHFLQPCSGLNNAEVIAYILGHPQWRLSLQTHKLLDIR